MHRGCECATSRGLKGFGSRLSSSSVNLTELCLKRGPLVGTQAAHATRFRYA
jgi:hypothetical protein